jgi:2',3'-cyclic-nucleotide 2'-phosphodiesterase (5'-nucleotidase family)
MGYDAVAVGPLDLAAGASFPVKQGNPHFPWISANLLNTDDSPVFPPFIIKKTGQSKTGIIGLTGNASLPANLHTGDWHIILPAQLKILSKKCDHIILLSNLSKNDNDEIARHYPGIRIIISADLQSSNLNPVVSTNTLIVQTLQQGKYLGRLDIAWEKSSKWESVLDRHNGADSEETRPSLFKSQNIALQGSLPGSEDIEKIVSGIKQQINRLNTSSRQTETIKNGTDTQ